MGGGGKRGKGEVDREPAVESPTPEPILELGLGFWGSKTLLSAVGLGVFTELAKGPADADALIRSLGLQRRPLPDGAVHVFPDQHRRLVPVRAHPDRRRRGELGELPRGLTAPMRDENQLHAAVVELVALENAQIKYATVQNWYAGDREGRGGIYNFVTIPSGTRA